MQAKLLNALYCIRIGNKNAIFIGEKFLTSLSHDERSEFNPALTHESVASTICGPAHGLLTASRPLRGIVSCSSHHYSAEPPR